MGFVLLGAFPLAAVGVVMRRANLPASAGFEKPQAAKICELMKRNSAIWIVNEFCSESLQILVNLCKLQYTELTVYDFIFSLSDLFRGILIDFNSSLFSFP